MNMNELKELVAEQLGVEVSEISEEKSFIDDLGADSLDLFELAMAMEEKYEIEIPSEDLEKIKTVKDAATYIQGKIA